MVDDSLPPYLTIQAPKLTATWLINCKTRPVALFSINSFHAWLFFFRLLKVFTRCGIFPGKLRYQFFKAFYFLL